MGGLNHETLFKKLDEICKTQRVQEEIDALILQDLCYVTPRLTHEHAKLVQSIENNRRHMDGYGWLWFLWSSHDRSIDEIKRKNASRYKLLLDRLHTNQYSIVEEIRKRVLFGLNKTALSQLKEWEKTQMEIDELESNVQKSEQEERSLQFIHDIVLEIRHSQQTIEKKKSRYRQYQLTTSQPSLNRHFKHWKR